MDYSIYQLKREFMRDFGFMSFEDAERHNGVGSVKIDNYNKVYEFDLQSEKEIRLDDIFEIFNISRPDDFYGHSLSVSDVVGYKGEYWYCDSFGWKKLDWNSDEGEKKEIVDFFRQFEVGKEYRANTSRFDPLRVVKRTKKMVWVDNGRCEWRMRIRYDDYGNEYLVDSYGSKKYQEDYTYSCLNEV